MAVVKYSQNLFTTGELGPYMAGRYDHEIYKAGTKKNRNTIILPHGGFQTRRGLEYIDTPTQSTAYASARFDFNNEQEYLCLFSAAKVEIYKDGVSQASATTPYAASDLKDLKFVHSGDTLIVFHPDHPTKEIKRLGSHTSWSISNLVWDFIPFYRYNLTATLTPSGTTGSINLTLSAGYWTTDHVGVRIYVNEGIAKITSRTSATVAAATVEKNLANTTASKAWREEAWSAHHGYPRCGIFHENRLVIGGTKDAPQTIFASKTGDFYNFDHVVSDEESSMGFVFTLSTDQVHIIRDMKALQRLIIFTSEGEFTMDGGGNPVTATNVQIKPHSEYGVGDAPVIRVDDEIIYATRNGKEIRAIKYDFQNDQYKSDNYTLISNHLFDGSAPVRIAYLRSYMNTQSNLVFIVREDGKCVVYCINSSRDVLGPTVWTTTGGEFIDCHVVKSPDRNGTYVDTIYFVVKRDGTYYVESLTDRDISLDHFYYGTSGTAKTDWSGLSTLAEQEVQVVGDGFAQAAKTVNASGEVEIELEASEVFFGFPVESLVETMPIAFSINNQSYRGANIRKVKAYVQIYETKALKVDDYDLSFRNFGDDLLDSDLPSYTGMYEVVTTGISKDPTLTISNDSAFPATVLGYVLELQVAQ